MVEAAPRVTAEAAEEEVTAVVMAEATAADMAAAEMVAVRMGRGNGEATAACTHRPSSCSYQHSLEVVTRASTLPIMIR